MYCYEGTNITGERVVNPHRTQLNDALNESYPDSRFSQFSLPPEALQAWVCSAWPGEHSQNDLGLHAALTSEPPPQPFLVRDTLD